MQEQLLVFEIYHLLNHNKDFVNERLVLYSFHIFDYEELDKCGDIEYSYDNEILSKNRQ